MISNLDQTISTDLYKRTRHTDLYTIGYGMRPFQKIKDVLVNYQIDQVIDIRYNDYSENRDFNGQNTDLGYLFWKYGMTYIHRKDLGNPPAIQRLFKSNKRLWRKQFFSRFRLSDRLKLQALVAQTTTALLCAEKNPKTCHRTELADWIAKGSNPRIKVIHL